MNHADLDNHIALEYEEALTTLSEEERQVWQFFFKDDLTQKTIANRLNCSVKTVRKRLHSARQKLSDWHLA